MKTPLKKVFKIKLKVGDKVIVLSGKYKGQIGKVVRTHPKLNKVTVEGVNVVKIHRKPTRENSVGRIEEVTKPIWVSKVAIYEPTLKKASRIGYKLNKDSSKIRIYKKSNKEIS